MAKNVPKEEITIQFFVSGLSIAQPRAQPGKGGHVILAPADHAIHKWREGVRYEAQRAMHGRTPLLCALRVDYCFLMPRPKSMDSESMDIEIPHTKKPDTDNLVKAAKDALKMVCFGDDAQVSYEVVCKRYVSGTEAPGMYMRITEDKPRPWTGRLWAIVKTLLGVEEKAPGY
jgi:Holliday junction resolvase RusA-like endonuclease